MSNNNNFINVTLGSIFTSVIDTDRIINIVTQKQKHKNNNDACSAEQTLCSSLIHALLSNPGVTYAVTWDDDVNVTHYYKCVNTNFFGKINLTDDWGYVGDDTALFNMIKNLKIKSWRAVRSPEKGRRLVVDVLQTLHDNPGCVYELITTNGDRNDTRPWKYHCYYKDFQFWCSDHSSEGVGRWESFPADAHLWKRMIKSFTKTSMTIDHGTQPTQKQVEVKPETRKLTKQEICDKLTEQFGNEISIRFAGNKWSQAKFKPKKYSEGITFDCQYNDRWIFKGDNSSTKEFLEEERHYADKLRAQLRQLQQEVARVTANIELEDFIIRAIIAYDELSKQEVPVQKEPEKPKQKLSNEDIAIALTIKWLPEIQNLGEEFKNVKIELQNDGSIVIRHLARIHSVYDLVMIDRSTKIPRNYSVSALKNLRKDNEFADQICAFEVIRQKMLDHCDQLLGIEKKKSESPRKLTLKELTRELNHIFLQKIRNLGQQFTDARIEHSNSEKSIHVFSSDEKYYVVWNYSTKLPLEYHLTTINLTKSKTTSKTTSRVQFELIRKEMIDYCNRAGWN
jgi:hypothetical protein